MTVNQRETKTILVTGGTGQQGGAVAMALLADGWKVRSLVRDPLSEKAKRLAAAGVELVPGDFTDAASLRQAMDGVYGVFSVQPSSGQGAVYGISDEQEICYGKRIAEIALDQQVKHFIYTSAGAAGKGDTNIGHFDSKTEIENYIRSLPLRSTIIRPPAFMELLMLPGLGLEQNKFTFFLRPEQSLQVIAVEDIGKIVTALFAEPETFAGQTLEIAGDQVTGNQLQEILSQAAGRAIICERFSTGILQQNPLLKRLTDIIDDGRGAGYADIAALRQTFGNLLTLEAWLKKAGKPLLESALQPSQSAVALR